VTGAGQGARPGGGEAPRPAPAIARLCQAIDCVNEWMGRIWGVAIVVVTFAVIYEVVARGLFQRATLWANEVTIYLSAMAYLIAGGYALLHRRHVRIDVVYQLFPPRVRARVDLATFVFFLLYAGTLVWIGGQMAWTSFLQRETTGSPWDPPIWPVKMAIALAGVLLLLQGIANLLRELWPQAGESATP
jgi:TRAP-type mannitol/chloroaromatic compound transport system permease small subunit